MPTGGRRTTLVWYYGSDQIIINQSQYQANMNIIENYSWSLPRPYIFGHEIEVCKTLRPVLKTVDNCRYNVYYTSQKQ